METRFSPLLDLASALRKQPVGALLGLVLWVAISLLSPAVRASPWLEGLVCFGSLSLCIALEYLVRTLFGWRVQQSLKHREADREAELALERLEQARDQGFLDAEEAHQIGNQIYRRKIAGETEPKRRRRSYRPRKTLGKPPGGPTGASPAA